ncbi:hypothetical protein IVB22_26605 [Bradyrhizobium sp. 190]|uniref:hypothetical protein n=1 Tax=Bradyrhizobium sp. 190 TaxID=2782658 RepID=UPI001FF93F86|nr:hypothetical protein [Bradyrhizobium sp. 190]MCK1516063.1 hypothetical protein [Bradyrhizobium sp. 190]
MSILVGSADCTTLTPIAGAAMRERCGRIAPSYRSLKRAFEYSMETIKYFDPPPKEIQLPITNI